MNMGKTDDKNKVHNDTEETVSKSEDTKMPSKAIIDLFLMEQHDFLQKNRGAICRYSGEFKPLSKIIDLTNVKVKSIIVENNRLIVNISTSQIEENDDVVIKSLLANGGKAEIYPGGKAGIEFFNKEKNIKIIIQVR